MPAEGVAQEGDAVGVHAVAVGVLLDPADRGGSWPLRAIVPGSGGFGSRAVGCGAGLVSARFGSDFDFCQWSLRR
jgi:hypothetical protein